MYRSILRRRTMSMTVLAVAAVLTVAACSSAGGSSNGPKSLQKVTVTIGATINFAAPHVALEKGFWKQQGLDVNLVKQANGAPASLANLIRGRSLLAFTGGPSVIAPITQGGPLKLVVTVGLGYSIELTARDDFLRSRHITPASPLKEKVRALKGATLGYDVPGGSMDRFYRYLFKMYGVDPNKDVRLVTLRDATTELAALKRGDIDVMAGSPPAGVTAEAEGAGTLFIRPTEVPGLKDYPYLIGSTSAGTLKNKRSEILGVVRGLMQALDFIKQHPDQAKAVVREGFADMPQSAFDSAYKDVLKVMPPTPLITKHEFQTMTAFESQSKPLPANFTYDNIVASAAVKEALKK